MTGSDIARRRLLNQHIARPVAETPADVVARLCAIQAQDYAGAKWSLGLRLRGAADADVEQAFTDGAILRTHVMRPTWHLVLPADIRWMVALTARRVRAVMAHGFRQMGLDQAILARSTAALAEALQGGKRLTRDELRGALRHAGIAAEGPSVMSFLLMEAELEGIICSGPRHGKQFTYALLDERAPTAKTLSREEALAELTRRYFTSRGPASVHDFAWWSGLTVADAKAGIAMAGSVLNNETVDGQSYWFGDDVPAVLDTPVAAYLLPTYDELLMGYKDRSAYIDAQQAERIVRGLTFTSTILLDNRVVGTWKRTFVKGTVLIETDFFAPLTKAGQRAFAAAVEQYGAFLGMPVELA